MDKLYEDAPQTDSPRPQAEELKNFNVRRSRLAHGIHNLTGFGSAVARTAALAGGLIGGSFTMLATAGSGFQNADPNTMVALTACVGVVGISASLLRWAGAKAQNYASLKSFDNNTNKSLQDAEKYLQKQEISGTLTEPNGLIKKEHLSTLAKLDDSLIATMPASQQAQIHTTQLMALSADFLHQEDTPDNVDLKQKVRATFTGNAPLTEEFASDLKDLRDEVANRPEMYASAAFLPSQKERCTTFIQKLGQHMQGNIMGRFSAAKELLTTACTGAGVVGMASHFGLSAAAATATAAIGVSGGALAAIGLAGVGIMQICKLSDDMFSQKQTDLYTPKVPKDLDAKIEKFGQVIQGNMPEYNREDYYVDKKAESDGLTKTAIRTNVVQTITRNGLS